MNLDTLKDILYNAAKAQSIDFYKQPGDTLPRCAWPGCRRYCYSSKVDAHHLIVPRNYGVVINAPWNLVPLHPGHCHEQLGHGDGRDTLIKAFWKRLGMFIRLEVIDLETWKLSCKWQLYPQDIAPAQGDWVAGKAWMGLELTELSQEGILTIQIPLP